MRIKILVAEVDLLVAEIPVFSTAGLFQTLTFETLLCFQVVFEGIRGLSYRGDIALDDISLNDGSCPPQGIYRSEFIVYISS